MIVNYTPAAQKNTDDYLLMGLATRQIEQVLNETHWPDQTTATWDAAEVAGGPVYTLRLDHPDGPTTAEGRFFPADLRLGHRRDSRALSLLSQLQLARSNYHLTRLRNGD